MGSLGNPEDIKVVVTGFSQFHGVADNPTEEIVNELQEYWKENFGKEENYIAECVTLKVSADTCDKFLAQTARKFSHNDRVIWIHLGVDPGSRHIAVESTAVNNASFLSPDEDGCQYMYENIEADLPFDEPVQSKIDIDGIVENLSNQGLNVKKSADAGRFICNWIYFRSLRQAESIPQSKWQSLFVHVPHFHHIDKREQLLTICFLIRSIKESVSSRSTSDKP